MIENIINLNRETVQTKLKEDPLFKSLLFDKSYRDQLFDDAILSLDPTLNYSTTECSESIFKIPNSTMRHYVKVFKDYLDIFVEGRKRRLPFLTVYKLHMILLAIDRGESTSDILVILGLKGMKREEGKDVSTGKFSDDVLESIFHSINNWQGKMFHLVANQQDLHSAQMELIQVENNINQCRMQIEIYREKIHSHRLYKKMDRQSINVLRKSMELNQKKGFLGMFKKTELSPNQENEIIIDERELVADNVEVEFLNNIKELEEKISDFSQRKTSLESLVNEKRNLLGSNQHKLVEWQVSDEEDNDFD
jgi:hypothetical protein